MRIKAPAASHSSQSNPNARTPNSYPTRLLHRPDRWRNCSQPRACVTMQAENFTIEPAGERKPGAGHLHIIVDAECIKPGQDIPKDETHLHYGEGQLEADLDLTPGTHTLCLQAGDGQHIALRGEGMTQKITITVK